MIGKIVRDVFSQLLDNLNELQGAEPPEIVEERFLPFETKRINYQRSIEKYQSQYETFDEYAKNNVVRREYSTVGEEKVDAYSMNIIDQLLDKQKAAKIKEIQPENHAYDHEYLFDKENHLICTIVYDKGMMGKKSEPFQKFFHFHEEKEVVSIGFELYIDIELTSIERKSYENDLLTNSEIVFTTKRLCNGILQEKLNYQNGKLYQVIKYHYSRPNKISRGFLFTDIFTFTRDKQDNFDGYHIIVDDGGLGKQEGDVKLRKKKNLVFSRR